MTNENETSLNMSDSERIAKNLNRLLANYSLFKQNARGFRWHIKGGEFEELHDKFEELYINLQEKIDGIAERILTLGHSPENIYSEYISLSLIPESKKTWDGDEAIANILESYSIITTMQKEIIEKATEVKDEGTIALLNSYMQKQEKQVQMYTSFLNK